MRQRLSQPDTRTLLAMHSMARLRWKEWSASFSHLLLPPIQLSFDPFHPQRSRDLFAIRYAPCLRKFVSHYKPHTGPKLPSSPRTDSPFFLLPFPFPVFSKIHLVWCHNCIQREVEGIHWHRRHHLLLQRQTDGHGPRPTCRRVADKEAREERIIVAWQDGNVGGREGGGEGGKEGGREPKEEGG